MSAVYSSIPFDIYKSSIALFIAEILNKCLKEEVNNKDLFNFLEAELIDLDNNDFNSQFHIRFLLTLSQYFGISPNIDIYELKIWGNSLKIKTTNITRKYAYLIEKIKKFFKKTIIFKGSIDK